jgi:hypothetical protein
MRVVQLPSRQLSGTGGRLSSAAGSRWALRDVQCAALQSAEPRMSAAEQDARGMSAAGKGAAEAQASAAPGEAVPAVPARQRRHQHPPKGDTRPVSLAAWMRKVRTICKRSPVAKLRGDAAAAEVEQVHNLALQFSRVRKRELQSHAGRVSAAEAMARLLASVAGVDCAAGVPRLLSAAGKALLQQGALRVSPACTSAASTLIERAAAAEATYASLHAVAALSTAQCRFGVFHAPFWERIAQDLPVQALPAAGAAQLASELSKLRRQGHGEQLGGTALALVRQALRAANTMLSQHVAMVLRCVAADTAVADSLRRSDWKQIGAAIVAVTRDNQHACVQGLCNILTALRRVPQYETELRRLVEEPLAEAVGAAAWRRHAGPDHIIAAANASSALRLPLTAAAKRALVQAGAERARHMPARGLASLLRALADIGVAEHVSDSDQWGGRLRSAAQTALPNMNAEQVKTTVYALAIAGLFERQPIQEAALAALGNVAHDLNAAALGLCLQALARPRSCRSLRGPALDAMCAAVAREAPHVHSAQHTAQMLSALSSNAFRDASDAASASEAYDAVLTQCTLLLPQISASCATQVLDATLAPVFAAVASAPVLHALREGAQARCMRQLEDLDAAGVKQAWHALVKHAGGADVDRQYALQLVAHTGAVAAEMTGEGPQIALVGIARLELRVPAATFDTLLAGVARCAPGFSARQVADALHAMAQLQAFGDDRVCAALEAAVERTALDMGAHDLVKALNAFSRRGAVLGLGVRRQLHSAAARLTPEMDARGVVNAVTGLSGLRPRRLPRWLWGALRAATMRTLPNAAPDEVPLFVLAYNRFGIGALHMLQGAAALFSRVQVPLLISHACACPLCSTG